eukprot:scaffold75946_cov67-Phaeocystis_antarctica.AAC.2
MLGRACPSAWNCCGDQSVAWKRGAGEVQERCTLHQHRPAIRCRPRSKRTTCGVLNDNLPQRLEVSPQRSPPRGHALHRLRHWHKLRAILHRTVSHERRALPQHTAGADCDGLVGEGEILDVVPVKRQAGYGELLWFFLSQLGSF